MPDNTITYQPPDTIKKLETMAQKIAEIGETQPQVAEVLALMMTFTLEELKKLRDRADRAAAGLPF